METIIKIKDDEKSQLLYKIANFLESEGFGCIVNHRKSTVNVMEKWRKEARLKSLHQLNSKEKGR